MKKELVGTRTNRGSQLLAPWMRSNRVTPTVLGAYLGVSAQTVYTWTRAGARPRADLWERIETRTGGAVPMLSWLQPATPDEDKAAE